jgi:2-dehydro-3-deoxyphosphogalactonate aldolase
MSNATAWPELKRGLVAILRGLEPHEAADIGNRIFEAGIEAIEIPLNSPDPFRSVEIMAETLPAEAIVGAGTVLTVEDVDRLADCGGRLMVSPNVDATVIARACKRGLTTMPGVFTATEAIAALKAGASGLKFFPASALGPSGIAAIRTILPADTKIGAVGGVSEKDFSDYAKVRINIFGLGSSLYRPGFSASEIGERAKRAVAAWDNAFAA